MFTLVILIPVTLFLSIIGIATFLWSLKNKQYDDLEGSANRILFDEDEDCIDEIKKKKEEKDNNDLNL